MFEKTFIMETHMPLMAHTQSIEATVKDLTLRKIQNRDEITSSYVSSARSHFAPNANQSMKEDEDFITRKRANEEAKDFFGNKLFNKHIMNELATTFPTTINQDEFSYCYNLIGATQHIKSIRTADVVHDIINSTPKDDNATIRKTGVDFAPLLEGCMQFGKLGTAHKSHAQNELRLRNVAYEDSDGIRILSSKIKESEYPGWSELEDSMSDEQMHRLKFFSPRCLSAQEWDKDYIMYNPN